MDALFSQLDSLIPALQEEYNVPGVGIAIVKDDQIVYARGFGSLAQGQPEPVDADSLFGIGSCTKAFTATAVGMLVEEGKLGWDDPVTKYLPHFQLYDPVATREITIRDLLCHRVGFATFSGDFMGYGSRYTDEEALERIRYIPPAFHLRTGYGYANLMYMTAGLVIQAVSGLNWHDFIRRRLLEPLGMTRTLTNADQLPGVADVAQPHQLFHDQLVPLPHLQFNNGAAAGALISSPRDMAAWLRFQLNRGRVGETQLVSEAVIDEMRNPHTLMQRSAEEKKLLPRQHFAAYGLGWFLSDYGGRLTISHGGGVDGMLSNLTFLPEEQVGYVILTNAIPHYLNGALGRTIQDGILGFHERDWRAEFQELARKDKGKEAEQRQKLEDSRPKDTHPSLPLAAYAGTYTNPLYGSLTVSVEGDELTIQLGGHPQAHGVLEHWHTDTFFVRWAYVTLEESFVPFSIGLDGTVESLKVKVAAFVDPLAYEFKRVE
jgi:CubicO group peptidase (beta-lactamase class C family)